MKAFDNRTPAVRYMRVFDSRTHAVHGVRVSDIHSLVAHYMMAVDDGPRPPHSGCHHNRIRLVRSLRHH